MANRKILLTGASGSLGSYIKNCFMKSQLLCPSHFELDISNESSVLAFFSTNDFDIIIHCAAIARMSECESNPQKAIDVNVIGTANLVKFTLRKQNEAKKTIRFLLISTDGVYDGKAGNFSESGPAIPYNKYGWTKLGAECCVNLLDNFCIIRTSFFDGSRLTYYDSPTDSLSSKMPVGVLAMEIKRIALSKFNGTLNVGGRAMSDYERYRRFIPQLKKCRLSDIHKRVNFNLPSDSSMNLGNWKKNFGKKRQPK